METSEQRVRSRQLLWIALIWSSIGLFEATQTVFTMRAEGMHHAWVRLFFTLLLGWLPLIALTPVVLQLGRRYPPVQLHPLSTWVIHLSACVALCAIATAWGSALEKLLNPWAPSSPSGAFMSMWWKKFDYSLLAYLILYSSILAYSYVMTARERLMQKEAETARLNEQLSKAQLHTLRQQIEPHFLFNTLNAIAGLVREARNDDAVRMIAGLSDFLRRVVQNTDRQEVTLGEEMDFLQRYLDIQKVRFAERLQLSVNIPEELDSVRVPSLLLQPIVENAVKHGIAKRVHGGAIRISAVRLNGAVCISVYNDGPELAPDWLQTNSGIGISNLQTRLRKLYGDGFEFHLENRPNGVEATVSVPYVSAAGNGE
jgi:two-component system LytT family sensor kinase